MDKVEVTQADSACADAIWKQTINWSTREVMDETIAAHRTASTDALEAENARLTAMVSACAGDLDIANEEILAQLDARKRTETENAACSVRLDEANAAAQDFKEQAASLKAENERLTNAVHSCHAECSRPLCVAQRENAGLTARVAELENCIRAADKLCDATIRLVDGFELRAALRKDQP